MKQMKIACLCSGGVDSSVALTMLKNEGHDVTAFYIKIWLEDKYAELGECPWEEDLKYVEGVCNQLDVPLKIVSLQKEYWDEVVNYTINEVKEGRTPNPDMLCNKRIKFGEFFKHVDFSKYDFVASGHYAQNKIIDGKNFLIQSPDPVKDQTYFLAMLSKKQLEKILFPIGHLNKTEVRELADKFNLPNKDRKDSQGICFLGKIKFKEFVKAHVGEKEGNIVEFETGKILGKHPGFYFFTIGQREGLFLHAGPWYVVDKNPGTNEVFVSNNPPSKHEGVDQFMIGDVNWITKPEKEQLQVKVRHGPQKYDCTIKRVSDKFEVVINGKDQGIASGQFAVFYDNDVCLGGGVILEK